ncbi:MAG: polysaccharide deacetylase family protein [Solirubrobacteraceae bacterium]|jgi:peptidoglycan/xylan/chitin deacetylase (PgdA/CDA1 family)
MKTVYLTIDDSPSEWMAGRVALLSGLGMPAVFFCTGSQLSASPQAPIEAIRRGFVIGNHAWSHPHFSQLDLTQANAEISSTDRLIDRLYARAGRERNHRWFRFPFGDQGDDFACDAAPPSVKAHKLALQASLRALGYRAPPFADVTHAWFWPRRGDADWYWTFDSMDWAVSQNELSVDEALARLDVDDPSRRLALGDGSSADIVLLHDHNHSARAFERLIEALASRPLRFALPG